ncbi:MAG: hypothetical protein KAQ90_04890, partial [Melioribacteraceae bacterium]|nr:hypothetical protein [Melioribacteraceae bacterium]
MSDFSDSTSISAELENYNWYFWRINARNNSGDTSHWSDPYLFKTKLSEPVLVSPSNNSSTVTNRYAFSWEGVKGGQNYNFQLADNPEFSSLLVEITISDSIYFVDSLALNTMYYWRVRGINNAGDISNWPSPYIFTTTNVISSTSLIAKELNFSDEPSDTVGIVTFNNVGEDEITYNFIEALPDSIFSTDKNSLTLSPNSFGSLTVLADTSEIDTGYYYGTLNLISQLSVGRNDTTKIPIVLNSLKAIGSISVDTLIYDTTLAKSSNTKEITIRNKGGNFQLDLIDFKFSGPNSESFKITEAPEFIPPNDSAKILIEFDPEMQDSNSAELAIETNTYPKEIFNINLSGIGKGASFSESTIASLQSISDSTFESLTSNDKEIIFINNGTVQLKFDVRFTENYFRVSNTSNTNIRVEPGDSVIISLQYLTPNFDTLNIDTMKIYHNAFGENPMDIVINGTYDSLQSSNEIISKLYINGSLFTGENYLVEERTSITASVNSESLLEQPNLNFKLNYFQGGPGEKLSATKNGPDKYIIPFQHLTNRGLIFKGELFTKGMSATEIDSITIFEFVDVEVVFDNYSTGKINVPRSSPATSADLADSKWAFFGFPFEEIIADSLFAAFGGISNMEDGEWIVYEYDESNPGSFTQFSGFSFNPNQGYFIAQALRNDFDISYNYQHQLKSRKLTDTEILLDGTGWKTISSP